MQQVHLSAWTPQPAALQLFQPLLRWQQGGGAEGVMLLCSWDRVSNPMDTDGSGVPMGATSSAVWAPGKQSHSSCHCWVCLAQQSLCCVTEGKCQITSHHSSPRKQAEVSTGAHATMCCTEQWATGEPPWGHTSQHSPYVSQLSQMCKLHTSRPHAWGLWRNRPKRQELGQSWPRFCR